MLTNKFATTAKAKHPVHWVKGFASCVYIQCNLKNTVIIISEHCNLNRCQYCSPLPPMGKENSFENHLELGQKSHSCFSGSLWSLQNSDTREAAIQPLREDIPARMISSTKRMLVAITVQE